MFSHEDRKFPYLGFVLNVEIDEKLSCGCFWGINAIFYYFRWFE